METNRPEWLKSLSKASAYPGDVQEVNLVETHISWVFLAGDRVYKIKKPVDFGFLDYTTLEKRRYFCQEEVRLNRRLCPQIYLGVVPVVRDGAEYRIGSPEEGKEAVEWAVEMRRMPEEGRMDRLIQKDLLDSSDIQGLCDILIPFYRNATCSGEKARLYGGIESVEENCSENFQQTEEFKGNLISEEAFRTIRDYTEEFLKARKALFSKRRDGGATVEGHGDLYSANICFDKQCGRIYVFDCIEFNERFRFSDRACDIAFLLMDLDFLGLADLSARLFDQYYQGLETDEDFEQMADLVRFYKCYRAYVRGKIACFTHESIDGDDTDGFKLQQRALAERYFSLASRYARTDAEAPWLIAFSGLSGTGKSTIAKLLAERTGFAYFNSDVVRKEVVAGITATESRLEPMDSGIYSPEFTARTYRALSRLAGQNLVVGQGAIVDATYSERARRQGLKELAQATGAKLLLVHCVCSDEVAAERLDRRFKEPDRVSDGRIEIYLEQKKRFEPPVEEEADLFLELDTGAKPEILVDRILERMKV